MKKSSNAFQKLMHYLYFMIFFRKFIMENKYKLLYCNYNKSFNIFFFFNLCYSQMFKSIIVFKELMKFYNFLSNFLSNFPQVRERYIA